MAFGTTVFPLMCMASILQIRIPVVRENVDMQCLFLSAESLLECSLV